MPREIAFLPDGMGSIEGLLQDAYRSFSGSRDVAAVEAELAGVKAESAAVKAELSTFKASTSWRVTAPLRQFVTLIGHNSHRSISTNASD